jgi:NAD(P)H-hydrate epimerase
MTNVDRMELPRHLYSAAQARELDRRAIEQHRIAGGELMRRAGQAAYWLLRARYPRAARVVVVCGPGNNGGDGYVVARLAHEAGLSVRVLALGERGALKGDAEAAHHACVACGVRPEVFAAGRLDVDVIVDAIFGTGLEREVTGPWRTAVEAINASGRPVIALDIPSGLHADTGRVLGVAVCAAATISFIGLKVGLLTGAGREHCGEIYVDDLGLPEAVYQDMPPAAQRIVGAEVGRLLPRRRRDAHKGAGGHVLVIGGARGMPGAARMAGEAAYRSGAGLVTIATHPAHAAALNVGRPELIVHGVEDRQALGSLLAQADCIALGPGLGQGEWARLMLVATLESARPLVVDADALNLISRDPVHREDWVLTPHPGEAARLIGASLATDVQGDRLTAVRAVSARYGGTCVLKGSGTLVATHREAELYLCDRGNPGMASGGVGDVLTGIIAALVAQGLTPPDAARLGVWLHATAGDLVAREGERGLLASDLLGALRKVLHSLTAP